MRTAVTTCWLATLTTCSASCLYPEIPKVYDGGSDVIEAVDAESESAEMIPVFNNCLPSNYIDLSADGASRTIHFGGDGPSDEFAFTPRCITIAAGQTVTFQGPFTLHPIAPGISATNMTAGSADNPIPVTASGTSVAVTFPAAGNYPFFCEMHFASNMAGCVHVR